MTTTFSLDPTDPPDRGDRDNATDSLENLRTLNATRAAEVAIEDEDNPEEDLELPGADLSDLELLIDVVPTRPDEFTCSSCFLVQHRTRRATADDVCTDCA